MSSIAKLRELSFLVYGLGLSGLSVVKFFKKNKINNFKVWDDKKINQYKSFKTNNLGKSLKIVDYIILSPGVSLEDKKYLKKFKMKIITDIDLFFLINDKAKTIVVTGTNGKSTTCKLLEHLLKKNKFKCFIGGNIGNPILDLNIIKNSFIIIEASSYQLSHSQFIRPDYAFFLNFTNDHLDWHGSMNNYLNAKLKIFHYQTQDHFAIINKKFKKIFNKKKFLSKLILPKYREMKKIKYKIDNNYLNSNSNNENMSYVFAFSKLLNITENSFINSMKSFKGLPHRFEIFLKKKNVTFINDSKATSFIATKSALSSLKNIYWILGGLPKKGDNIKLLKYKKNIIKCYIIGKKINFFRDQIKGIVTSTITYNLENSLIQILEDIKLNKKSNVCILLSPAAASFDQFKNFEERGKTFKKLCNKYARKLI